MQISEYFRVPIKVPDGTLWGKYVEEQGMMDTKISSLSLDDYNARKVPDLCAVFMI